MREGGGAVSGGGDGLVVDVVDCGREKCQNALDGGNAATGRSGLLEGQKDLLKGPSAGPGKP
jgi:hypothetical protein